MKSFQGTERIIYEYILNHVNDLGDISAKQIAAIAHSNTTSVNRVCKKMGYASYTELRYSLPHDLREDSDFSEADTAKNKTIEKMTQAMKKVRVVYLYARGGSIVSVSYLSRFLSIANIPHLVITDIHQLALASEGLVLLISKSGETQAVIDLAHNAKRKGMKVFAISKDDSSLSHVSDFNINLNEPISGLSLYKRESQLRILEIIDQVGCQLLSS
ncbi:MAG: MurR/RpiR family transcriptional regulator [Endozoicomonas sp.]|uniref:MurR/RpiR family transcriptional regulator n=1 Tax=Endozoicomonas sp. TaxID=1892382 RepID=UPI003D9B5C0D